MKKILDSTIFLAAITGLLYLIGWVEREAYIHELALPRNLVSASFHYTVVRGFNFIINLVIEYSVWIIVVIFILCLFLVLLRRNLWLRKHLFEPLTKCILSASYLKVPFLLFAGSLIIVGIYLFSASTMSGKYEHGYPCSSNRITVFFTKPIVIGNDPGLPLKHLSGCLIESGSGLWVLSHYETGHLIIINQSNIKSVVIPTYAERKQVDRFLRRHR